MPTAKRAKPKLAVRSVTILGATGSIGSSTVDLLKRQPERFSVEALTAHKNGVALAQLARELGARFAAVADPSAYNELKSELSGTGIEVAAGTDAVVEAARRPADWVIGAITGAAGLEPALAAIERGATLVDLERQRLRSEDRDEVERLALAGRVRAGDDGDRALFEARHEPGGAEQPHRDKKRQGCPKHRADQD